MLVRWQLAPGELTFAALQFSRHPHAPRNCDSINPVSTTPSHLILSVTHNANICLCFPTSCSLTREAKQCVRSSRQHPPPADVWRWLQDGTVLSCCPWLPGRSTKAPLFSFRGGNFFPVLCIDCLEAIRAQAAGCRFSHVAEDRIPVTVVLMVCQELILHLTAASRREIFLPCPQSVSDHAKHNS